MNAALHALSNCPPLREFFRHYLLSNPEIQEQFSSSSASMYYHHILQNSSVDSVVSKRQMTVAFSDLLSKIWSDSQSFNIAPTFFLMVFFCLIFNLNIF